MSQARLFGDAVRAMAGEDPDAEMLVWENERISRGEAVARVDRLAKGLIAEGVEPGDRVALLADPRPDVFLLALAVSDIGGVFLGLNPKYTEGELAHIAGDAGPRLIFAFDEHAGGLPLVVDWAPMLVAGEVVNDDELYERRAAVAVTDPAVLVYTSGSTGRPKGALLSHGAIVLTIEVGIERKGLSGRTLVCNLPINHVGSLLDICGRSTIAGGVVHFQERFDPVAMMECIERERLNCWGGVPTIFQVCLDHPESAQFDLSSVELLAWGGAGMPADLLRALLDRTGATKCTSGYGSTETTGGLTFSDLEPDVELLTTTIGRPDPRLPSRIWHPDDREAEVGEAGEIQAHRSYTTIGYLGNDKATAAAFEGDWFHTGDLAVRRPDGHIELVGRLSEMFKSGGYNVYPREVELALEEHPAVSIAAVVGVPDPTYQEVGHAYVVAAPRTDLDVDELRSFARGLLANYKIPKTITVLAEMPRLAIGKIDKVALRALAAEAPSTVDL